MSLEEQIKLEEEELRQLEAEELAGEEGDADTDSGDGADTDSDANPGVDDAGADGSIDGDSGEDSAEGSDDAEDDKADEKEAAAGEEENPNAVNAQLRIERKMRKDAERKTDELLAQQRVQLPPAPVTPVNPPAQAEGESQEQAGPTAEQRLDARDAADAEKKLYGDAVEEFSQYERAFEQATPDYKHASTHMINAMVGSVRNMYPSASDKQVGEFVQKQVLTVAAQAVQHGKNPAEALYAMSHESYGYQAKAETNNEAPAKVSPAKKLATVSKNKRRSASPLSSGGQNGKPSATMEEAANMDMAEFSKLSNDELNQMIEDAQ